MKFALVEKRYSPDYRPGAGGEHDGGNYPQPFYTLVDDQGNVWEVADCSCGGFGTWYWITKGGETVAEWGTMGKNDHLSDAPFSLLSGYCAKQLEAIVGFPVLGGGVQTYTRKEQGNE